MGEPPSETGDWDKSGFVLWPSTATLAFVQSAKQSVSGEFLSAYQCLLWIAHSHPVTAVEQLTPFSLFHTNSLVPSLHWNPGWGRS